MITTVPQTLFGLPLLAKRVDIEQLREALSVLWTWQMGQAPGGLDDDLDALRRYFDPLATGRRLRTLLSALPSAPRLRAHLLRPPLFVGWDDRALITPEGRTTLDVVLGLLGETDNESVSIDPNLVYTAEHRVYERYRQWSLRRLDDVVALMSGNAEALRLPSIGLLLLLLINGSRSLSTALRPLSAPSRKERVDSAISTIIAEFCQALDERPRDPRHFVLYSGYPLTEARRRLPDALQSDSDGTYIPVGSDARVLSLVVAELRRPQRTFSTERVLDAFDRLVAAYREELPVLAALEMAFEQRAETRRLRQRLEERLDHDARA